MNRYRVEEILDELGIEILDENHGELLAACPGHKKRTGRADQHPSWSINIETGSHHCFSCGYGGSLAGLVATVQRVQLERARSWLTTYSSESLDVVDSLDLDPVIPAGPVLLPEADLARFTVPPGWALQARQIDAGAANALGLAWDPHRDAWVAPIRDPHTGGLWGWQLKGQTSRLYRNLPPGVLKSRALFGLSAIGSVAVLVESPLDVVRLHGLGIPAVASYGSDVSDVQMSLVLSTVDRLIVALDNPHFDSAGRSATLRLLRDYGNYGIRFWPYTPTSPKDPGDMTDAQILEDYSQPRHSIDGRRAVLVA